MVVPEAVKVCEPETTALKTLLGPCRNGVEADDNDVESETITPQDDDESAIST